MKKVDDLLDKSFPENINRFLALVRLWKGVVGDYLVKVTFPSASKNGILYVGVSDAMLRSEMEFLKDDILEKLKSRGFSFKELRFFLSFSGKKGKRTESAKRTLTEKEREVVNRYASVIKDEKVRESFKKAMFAYFEVYSWEDFIKNED